MNSDVSEKLDNLLTFMNWAGFVASLVSLFLGIFAIWLSWVFFRDSSNNANRAESALTSLKAQVDVLTRLNDQHISELTNILGKAIPNQETESLTISKLKELSQSGPLLRDRAEKMSDQVADAGNAIADHGLVGLADPLNTYELKHEYIRYLFAIYYYSIHANVLAGQQLPSLKEFEPSNGYHTMLRELMNNSFQDFTFSADRLSVIAKSEEGAIDQHPGFQFGEKGRRLNQLVMTADNRFDEIDRNKQSDLDHP